MRKFIRFLIFLFIIIFAIVGYSRYIATTGLITNEILIKTDDISYSYDGLKIVHFTDLHYKRIITENRINDIVEEINLINPDIVVFTGDLVDKDFSLSKEDKEFLITSLSNINSKYGKYAVIGNHDYKKNTDDIINIYQESNFILLDNDYDIIYNEYQDKIFIGGLNTVSYNQADIDKVMEYFNTNEDINYKIILVHEPDYADTIIEKYPSVNLILSGHSHNGQVNIPFIKKYVLPEYATKYYDSHYTINETELYVSSGIGVSRYNFRLFNRPSLNFYRIRKAS